MHPLKKAFRDKDVILKRFGVDGEQKIVLTQRKSHNKKLRADSTLAQNAGDALGLRSCKSMTTQSQILIINRKTLQ